jgi:hypothetical protein
VYSHPYNGSSALIAYDSQSSCQQFHSLSPKEENFYQRAQENSSWW